jgi:hypothetical protein
MLDMLRPYLLWIALLVAMIVGVCQAFATVVGS